MTNNEIKKYAKTYNPCDDCQHSFSKNNQESYVCKICEFKQALDLINRQQAEIDKLKIELKAMRGAAEEKKMVYFPFPIDCEKCPKATDIGVCEELDLLYDGKHPKYTKTQDWEFMCDTCPYEVHGRKYREEDDKDFIGKTLFFTEEEAEKALKEGYSDERIYKA